MSAGSYEISGQGLTSGGNNLRAVRVSEFYLPPSPVTMATLVTGLCVRLISKGLCIQQNSATGSVSYW